MNRIVVFALFFFVLTIAQAQDDVYKTIATETCECVSKRNIDTSKRSEVEMALGLCMLEGIQTHDLGIDITDDAAMSKFGEKVGLQMAPICPSLFTVFMEDPQEEKEVLELTGKIKSVETNEFLFVILKEDSGKEHALLWFRYFPGSDEFKDDPKKLVGKKITIVYQDIECYFPKQKAYNHAREIVELKIH
jgi:hypothetical protein